MTRSRVLLILCGFLAAGTPSALGAIEGVVQNGTTGRAESGVAVTLIKLEQAMEPAASTKSDAAGKFRFDQNVSGAPLMLRAEFEGVTYNQMIPPGSRTGDVRLTVYRAARATATAGVPEQHVMLFEPSGTEMIVNESFLYRNQAQPPVTYVNNEQGTLRFYLPAGAKGIVQVSAAGPGGVPVRGTAEKTGEPDIYKVSFPIKPGESRIDLTYLVPHQPGAEFAGKTLYPGVLTRIAAPSGVTLSGEGLESMGQEPQSKASIFNIGSGASFRVTIAGEGRLARAPEGGEGSGGESISIIPAAVEKQFWLIIGFAAAILGLGFYGLYTAREGDEPRPREQPKA